MVFFHLAVIVFVLDSGWVVFDIFQYFVTQLTFFHLFFFSNLLLKYHVCAFSVVQLSLPAHAIFVVCANFCIWVETCLKCLLVRPLPLLFRAQFWYVICALTFD